LKEESFISNEVRAGSACPAETATATAREKFLLLAVYSLALSPPLSLLFYAKGFIKWIWKSNLQENFNVQVS